MNSVGSMIGNTTLDALRQSAIFAERRHALLAANMANIDTPGYRSRDMSLADFQSALAETFRGSVTLQPSTPEGTNRDYFPGHGFAETQPRPGTDIPTSPLAAMGGTDEMASGIKVGHTRPLDHAVAFASDNDTVFRDAMQPIVRHDDGDVSIEQT
ncbi:MAG: hypothetical protein AAFN70_14415, partial [Planctomycetota bacterium]